MRIFVDVSELQNKPSEEHGHGLSNVEKNIATNQN